MTGKATETIKQFNAQQTIAKTATPTTPEENETAKTKKEQIADKAVQKTADDLKKEEEERLQAEEQARLDAIDQMQTSIAALIERVNARVEPAKTWVSSLPTPTGLAGLVIAILLFALAVIPVDSQGHTRLYLFYQSLLGRTHMKYQETSPAGSVSTGGGADFGGNKLNGGGSAGLNGIDLSHLNLFGLE